MPQRGPVEDGANVPEVVHEAYKHGWTVIPQRRDKSAFFRWKEYQKRKNRPDWSQIEKWSRLYPNDLWAVVTGKPGELIVLDFDGPQGEQTRKKFELKRHVRTPGGGSHVWVHAPDYRVRGGAPVDPKNFPGMDLKANGMLATIHGKRGTKSYRRTQVRKPYELEDLPPKVRKLIESRRIRLRDAQPVELPKGFTDFAYPSDLLGQALYRVSIGHGRNDAGFWLACQLRDELVHKLGAKAFAEAEHWMYRYAEDVADRGDHPYSKQEAYDSLAQAFSEPPRTPRRAFADDGIIRLDEVRMENVSWLWKPWLPLGKLVLLDGNKGRAKSTIIYSLIASVTTGRPFPGEPAEDAKKRKPAGCILFTNEEGVADTIKPKLIAAGADLKLVRQIVNRDRTTRRLIPIKFPDDYGYVEQQIQKVQAEINAPVHLITIDPVMSYLSDKLHYGNDPHVRDMLIPLVDVAQELGATALIVRHLNKNISLDAEHRGGGSVAFPSVARVHMLAEWDPENQSIGVLAQVNNNITMKPPAWTYQVVEQSVTADGVEAETFAVRWGKATSLTANNLLAKQGGRKANPKRQEYRAWLEKMLAGGRAVRVDKLKRQFKAAGYTGWRELAETVAPEMSVIRDKHYKKGKVEHWTWRLPSPEVVRANMRV